MPVKQIGQRMTSQRKLLLDIIRNAQGHLDADEIFIKAKERDPRISLSTVYRNLNLLKESGLVSELHLFEGHHHYELNILPLHHHVVCLGCGSIVEFESEYFDKIKAAIENDIGFKVNKIEIDVRGYCRICQESEING